MKYQLEDEEHEVIYIEYQDNIPHAMVTRHFINRAQNPYWSFEFWDVFANNGDNTDLYLYNSGSGSGTITAPQYVEDYKGGSYWIAEDVEFDGEPKNATKLEDPILLNGYESSTNPFEIAEITNSYEYCDRCGHASTEFCYEHKYEDEEGIARYIDDNSSAE
ncbi:MAG: hypothetical protein ACM3ME_06695 [Chloroflexota bacterium]